MYRLAKNEFFQFELKNSWHFITILCRKESIIRDFDLLCNLLFVVKMIISEATTPSFKIHSTFKNITLIKQLRTVDFNTKIRIRIYNM